MKPLFCLSFKPNLGTSSLGISSSKTLTMADKRNKRKRKEMEASSIKSDPIQEEEEEEVVAADHISKVPDCILTSILSLLPIQDSARTTVLSSRWRHLSSISPLHIDARTLSRRQTLSFSKKTTKNPRRSEGNWRIKSINKILSSHRGPILSFRLSSSISTHLSTSHHTSDLFHAPYQNWRRFDRTLDRWIGTLARNGIQNLALYYKLPPLASACRSLSSLQLTDVKLDEPRPMPPNLRELRLARANITDNSLSHILSSCRVLESLELLDCWDMEFMHISSLCLRKLTVHSVYASKLLIEDAPNLELLLLDEFFTDWMSLEIVDTSKLRRLGIVNANAKMLRLGQTCFRLGQPVYLRTQIQSLRALAIRVNFHDDYQSKTLIGLLRCFPRLETLDLLSTNAISTNLVANNFWEEEGSFDCLDHHLKSVKIKGFAGNYYEQRFVRSVIKNGQVLKLMALFCARYCLKKRWEEITAQLFLDGRACLDAQLNFIEDDHERDEDKVFTWESLFDQ